MINESKKTETCTRTFRAIDRNSGYLPTSRALPAMLVAGMMAVGLVHGQAPSAPSPRADRNTGQQTDGGMLASPADMMMGGNPKSNLVAGSSALRGITHEVKTPMPGWADGLIKLDPVCETIEPPSPKFAP